MKRFQSILAASLVGFAVFSAATYFLRSDGHGLPEAHDGIRRLGWPTVFWEEGGFAYRHTFSVVALLIDLSVAVVAGVLISVMYGKRARKSAAS